MSHLIILGKLIPWDDFTKQLEPAEEIIYAKIVFMAQELGEPQEVTIEGITIGLLWPSGAFQKAYRIPDDQKPTFEQFIDGANP